MATSIWAIEVIEVDEVTGVTVLCISNLIVVQSKEGHMNVNYNFLVKIYSELTSDQKLKFTKNVESSNLRLAKVI